MADGWYERVRIQDGVIVEAQEFSEEQVVIENPCAVGSTGGDGAVSVSQDACNLTAQDSAGALLTRLNYVYDQYLRVNGCGSLTAPLSLELDIGTVQAEILSGGINYSRCGFEIRDGVIRSWVDPITTLTSNNPNIQIIRNGCNAEIATTAIAMSVVYTRPWCTRTNPGDPPSMQGLGVVRRGAGNTAVVEIHYAFGRVTTGAPTPPSTFATVQEAVNWVDANLGC